MAHAPGLTAAILPAGPSGPASAGGTGGAMDAGERPGGALGRDRHGVGVRSEVAGVDDLDAGPGPEVGHLVAGPLDEFAGGEEPEEHADAVVAQLGRPLEGVRHRWPRDAGEADIDGGGA